MSIKVSLIILVGFLNSCGDSSEANLTPNPTTEKSPDPIIEKSTDPIIEKSPNSNTEKSSAIESNTKTTKNFIDFIKSSNNWSFSHGVGTKISGFGPRSLALPYCVSWELDYKNYFTEFYAHECAIRENSIIQKTATYCSYVSTCNLKENNTYDLIFRPKNENSSWTVLTSIVFEKTPSTSTSHLTTNPITQTQTESNNANFEYDINSLMNPENWVTEIKSFIPSTTTSYQSYRGFGPVNLYISTNIKNLIGVRGYSIKRSFRGSLKNRGSYTCATISSSGGILNSAICDSFLPDLEHYTSFASDINLAFRLNSSTQWTIIGSISIRYTDK